jgi:RNA-binding protein Musashi
MGQYGPVEACTIMRDPNGRSRGFAFLTYKSADSVTKVLAEVHHLDGKQVSQAILSHACLEPSCPTDRSTDFQIDPKRAIPRAEHERTAKVFVGGLAATVTSESLRVFLTQFGPVMDATVMFDRETGRSKGFAFATFGNEESVGVAMAASGVELEGKAVSTATLQRSGTS